MGDDHRYPWERGGARPKPRGLGRKGPARTPSHDRCEALAHSLGLVRGTTEHTCEDWFYVLDDGDLELAASADTYQRDGDNYWNIWPKGSTEPIGGPYRTELSALRKLKAYMHSSA